jgi:hypothetical protein
VGEPSNSKLKLGIGLFVTLFIELVSELLRFLAQTMWLEVKWHNVGIPWDWEKLRIGALVIALSLGVVAAAIAFLEARIDLTGRIWILVTALVILGALEPGRLIERETLIQEIKSIHQGQDTASVLKTIKAEPWLVQMPEPPSVYSVCSDDCSMRLIYELPSLWEEHLLTITFDAQGKVKSVSDLPKGWL